jgi:hypothetical protein
VQCDYVLGISKTASLEGDHLETDVRSASGGIDATARHEILREPSAAIVPVFREILRDLLHTSRSTDAITGSSSTGFRTVRGRPAITCAVCVTIPV